MRPHYGDQHVWSWGLTINNLWCGLKIGMCQRRCSTQKCFQFIETHSEYYFSIKLIFKHEKLWETSGLISSICVGMWWPPLRKKGGHFRCMRWLLSPGTALESFGALDNKFVFINEICRTYLSKQLWNTNKKNTKLRNMAIKTGLFGSLKIKSEQVKNIVLGSKFSKFNNSELEISAGNKHTDMKVNKRKKSPSGEKEFLLEDQDW